MDRTVKGLYTYSKAADIEAAFARPVDDPVQPGLGIKVSVSIEGKLTSKNHVRHTASWYALY